METSRHKVPLVTRRPPRSVSPNNVVINGQIIDKKSSENIIGTKRILLDNILEESDPQVFEAHYQNSKYVPLEDAVRRADENVQRFINELSNTTGLQENDKEFESICKNSQEELKSLSNFLSTIDENSKSKIINTLLNVYRNEIVNGIRESTPKETVIESENKISKFKNICRGLVNEYQKNPSTMSALEVPLPQHISSNSGNPNEKAEVFAQYDRLDIIAANLAEIAEKNEDKKYQDETRENMTDDTISSISQESEPLNLYNNFTVNYQTSSELAKDYEKSKCYNPFTSTSTVENCNRLQSTFLADSLIKNDSLKNSSKRRYAKKTFANLPLEIRYSTERAINKILGRELKGPIAQTEYSLRKNIEPTGKSLEKKRQSITFYQATRKLLEDPKFSDIDQYISQGVQASLPLQKKIRKERKNAKVNKVDFIKPFKYQYDSSHESRSDIALGCTLGYQLMLKTSKSDTDTQKLKASKKRERKRKREHKKHLNEKKAANSLIEVERKCSLELILAKDIRRKNQLISYLDKGLRRGDSEFHFSQVLFETANKNIDNDVSAFEIPSLDLKHVDNFNANYLLHTLKLRQSKADILPKNPLQHFGDCLSEVSITEEDYKCWLEKQNWLKYSNTTHEVGSFQNLRSISETVAAQKINRCGEYGYYLDRGDYNSASSASNQTCSILSDFRELFLYEQIVISKAINFFLTFNAKRTRILNKWDRCIQILFFIGFYATWIFFSEYVFVEPKSRKKAFWK